ncbi:MAG: hydrolase TatD [Flaviaesturariibacter sp.]|nr:hydrolase TatD [Flaviaesturariibacter sp.]
MELIDTHAHIYLPEFEKDKGILFLKAAAGGVQQVLMPAIDSTTHAAMLQMEADYSQTKAMMGLHPCSVKEDYRSELDSIHQFLEQRKFIAIGEIGLDFYWDKTFMDQQYEAFHQQIKWALQYGLPIAIHSRNATDECIGVIKQYPELRGVFHCFSGTVFQAETIMEAGFFLGIGGVVTFKNGGLDIVVQEIGLDKVVLETDAPYLAPVPFRGKRNESSYLKIIAEKVAALTNHSLDEVAAITTRNAKNLFRLA